MTDEEQPSRHVDVAPSEGGPGADRSWCTSGDRRDPVGPFREPVRFTAVETAGEQLLIYDREVTDAWIQSDCAVDLPGHDGRPRHRRNHP